MTLGDLFYRVLQGRDPPWNNDAAMKTVGMQLSARPERLVEWLHAVNPLRVYFCECGRIAKVCWSRRYVTRVLYKGACASTSGRPPSGGPFPEVGPWTHPKR